MRFLLVVVIAMWFSGCNLFSDTGATPDEGDVGQTADTGASQDVGGSDTAQADSATPQDTEAQDTAQQDSAAMGDDADPMDSGSEDTAQDSSAPEDSAQPRDSAMTDTASPDDTSEQDTRAQDTAEDTAEDTETQDTAEDTASDTAEDAAPDTVEEACDGAELNACGGCAALSSQPQAPCGVCDTGAWQCDGMDAVVCEGDGGEGARNACGGCGALGGAPDAACGDNGRLVCDGGDALRCEEPLEVVEVLDVGNFVHQGFAWNRTLQEFGIVASRPSNNGVSSMFFRVNADGNVGTPQDVNASLSASGRMWEHEVLVGPDGEYAVGYIAQSDHVSPSTQSLNILFGTPPGEGDWTWMTRSVATTTDAPRDLSMVWTGAEYVTLIVRETGLVSNKPLFRLYVKTVDPEDNHTVSEFMEVDLSSIQAARSGDSGSGYLLDDVQLFRVIVNGAVRAALLWATVPDRTGSGGRRLRLSILDDAFQPDATYPTVALDDNLAPGMPHGEAFRYGAARPWGDHLFHLHQTSGGAIVVAWTDSVDPDFEGDGIRVMRLDPTAWPTNEADIPTAHLVASAPRYARRPFLFGDDDGLAVVWESIVSFACGLMHDHYTKTRLDFEGDALTVGAPEPIRVASEASGERCVAANAPIREEIWAHSSVGGETAAMLWKEVYNIPGTGDSITSRLVTYPLTPSFVSNMPSDCLTPSLSTPAPASNIRDVEYAGYGFTGAGGAWDADHGRLGVVGQAVSTGDASVGLLSVMLTDGAGAVLQDYTHALTLEDGAPPDAPSIARGDGVFAVALTDGAAGEREAFVTFLRDGDLAPETLEGQLAAPVSLQVLVNARSSHAAVQWDGEVFHALHLERDQPEAYAFYVHRFDGSTDDVGDAVVLGGIDLNQGGVPVRPAFAVGDGVYGVVWKETGNCEGLSECGLKFAAVSQDGVTNMGEVTLDEVACPVLGRPSIAWNGAGFVVAWSERPCGDRMTEGVVLKRIDLGETVEVTPITRVEEVPPLGNPPSIPPILNASDVQVVVTESLYKLRWSMPLPNGNGWCSGDELQPVQHVVDVMRSASSASGVYTYAPPALRCREHGMGQGQLIEREGAYTLVWVSGPGEVGRIYTSAAAELVCP